MSSQRSRSLRQGRVARRLLGPVTVSATVVLAGCSAPGGDTSDGGPPRISPPPRPEVAAAMVDDRPEPQTRLDACELLDLTTAEVIELTDSPMPLVDPMGSGELGMLCTYGGPGSPERYLAELGAAAEPGTSGATATETAPATATGTAAVTPTAGAPDSPTTTGEAPDEGAADQTATTWEPTTPPTPDPDYIPDTFAAGVIKPRGGAGVALAGQAAMLGNRYACSEIRGEDAETIEGGGAGAPEAPAVVRPDVDAPYIDCTAAPTGGGVEAHTIFVADNDLWHVTLVRPGTPRSPEADADALAGLHRVAEHVLD